MMTTAVQTGMLGVVLENRISRYSHQMNSDLIMEKGAALLKGCRGRASLSHVNILDFAVSGSQPRKHCWLWWIEAKGYSALWSIGILERPHTIRFVVVGWRGEGPDLGYDSQRICTKV